MKITIPMSSQGAYIFAIVLAVGLCSIWMGISVLWNRHKVHIAKEMGQRATTKHMVGNIPVADILDKRVLRNSLEQQEFVQLDIYLWESKDWVRIWTKFFPKNIIVGMKVSGRDSEMLEVRTLMGKVYKIKGEKDFFPLRQQEDKLSSLFPFSRILYETDMAPFSYGDGEKERKQLKNAYCEYMRTHTTEDLITRPELAEQCAEAYCLERFGNGRKMLEKHRKRTADERARTVKEKSNVNTTQRRKLQKVSWSYYIMVWVCVLILFGIGPLLSLGKRLGTDKVPAEVVAVENWDAQSHRANRRIHSHFVQDLTLRYEWNGKDYTIQYNRAEVPFSGYEAGEKVTIYVDKENGEHIYTAKELDVTVNVIFWLLWGVGLPSLCFWSRKRKNRKPLAPPF